jgi:hypothetical protein
VREGKWWWGGLGGLLLWVGLALCPFVFFPHTHLSISFPLPRSPHPCWVSGTGRRSGMTVWASEPDAFQVAVSFFHSEIMLLWKE